MKKPDIPVNEAERLKILSEYDILDTLPEKGFDDITRVAAQICQTPIALVCFIDSNRQWFKSHHGFNVTETPRDMAFCAHAILKPTTSLIIPNAREDERFTENALVMGELGVVFYAGVPLVNPEGFALGTLCVIDYQPRVLTPEQKQSLEALAGQVIVQLELRRKVKQLKQSQQQLTQFAYVVAHDLKAPLSHISGLAQLLTQKYTGQLDEEGLEMMRFLNLSAQQLTELINGILASSTPSETLSDGKEEFSLTQLLEEIIRLIAAHDTFEFHYSPDLPLIYTSKTALTQILLNLFSNAVKYSNQAKGRVDVGFSQSEDFYHFQVSDNGPGIAKEHHQRIFELFQNLGRVDRFNQLGTGIGLATVKRVVQQAGGNIQITSQLNVGTTFSFTLKK